MEKQFTAVIEKTSTGFSGYFKEVDGVITAADTIMETKKELEDALKTYLDYLKEKGLSTLEIKNVTINYVVDLQQFFEYFDMIKKSSFADYIGVNRSLFRQYTTGLTDLSDKRLLHISKGLHKLAKDISDIHLVNG